MFILNDIIIKDNHQFSCLVQDTFDNTIEEVEYLRLAWYSIFIEIRGIHVFATIKDLGFKNFINLEDGDEFISIQQYGIVNSKLDCNRLSLDMSCLRLPKSASIESSYVESLVIKPIDEEGFILKQMMLGSYFVLSRSNEHPCILEIANNTMYIWFTGKRLFIRDLNLIISSKIITYLELSNVVLLNSQMSFNFLSHAQKIESIIFDNVDFGLIDNISHSFVYLRQITQLDLKGVLNFHPKVMINCFSWLRKCKVLDLSCISFKNITLMDYEAIRTNNLEKLIINKNTDENRLMEIRSKCNEANIELELK